jgi:hypothetical protein
MRILVYFRKSTQARKHGMMFAVLIVSVSITFVRNLVNINKENKLIHIFTYTYNNIPFI